MRRSSFGSMKGTIVDLVPAGQGGRRADGCLLFATIEDTDGNTVNFFINPDTHLRAVELLSAGRINVEPLITHTFGIGEMEQAIKMQMGGESIKVMVLPNKR